VTKRKKKPLNVITSKQLKRRIIQERSIVSGSSSTNISSTVSTENTLYNEVVSCEKENSPVIESLSSKISEEISVIHSKQTLDSEYNMQLVNFMPSETSTDKDVTENQSLHEKLVSWTLENNITHKALSNLLKIIRPHVIEDNLPRDARTLMQTLRTTNVKKVFPGEYYHFGLQCGIIHFLKQHPLFCTSNSTISVMINIDGLPIAKSSNSQVWPILGSIYKYNHVFIIGVYFGKEHKPASSNEFLNDFVQESKYMTESGFEFNGRKYKFHIKGISADAPAKSYMLCIKNHGGYSSCTKCTTEGTYIERRVCFPSETIVLRTDIDFNNYKDEDYHMGKTALTEIPGLGLVTNVPLDYQHLICLGVTKKLISLWLCDSLKVRLSSRKVKIISNSIDNNITPFVPLEFQRKPRSFNMWKQWKATELRQFLLYYGPIVLYSVVSEEVYIHFLILHVAIRILCTGKYCNEPEFINYCQDLLTNFVKTFKLIYGTHHISHNVHALLHLAKDVEHYGSLDLFSTFKFENYMQKIKKMIKKDDKPLQQIVRRIHEAKFNDVSQCNCDFKKNIIYYKLHSKGPLINDTSGPQYQALKFKEFTLISQDSKNQYCSTINGDIIKIYNISYHKKLLCEVIIGRKFLRKENLFTLPCLSSKLGIYEVHTLSKLASWPVHHIDSKICLYPIPRKKSKYAAFPLLHIDKDEIPKIQ